jgi:hypothetical protein
MRRMNLTRALALAVFGVGLATTNVLARAPRFLPDPRLTPGNCFPVTAPEIAVRGYAQSVRDVPEAVKRQVYAEYGITHHAPGEYEVDHLISLELGGSNDMANLWPEKYDLDVNGENLGAHTKDKLENRLHFLVVSGALDLKVAQRMIARDWVAAYRRVIGAPPRTCPLTARLLHVQQ